MKPYKVSGGVVPLILDFGTRWRRVVGLTYQLLYLWGNSSQ